MALIDKLREESNSKEVAFVEFVLKLRNHSEKLCCFFEGKDDIKYYRLRINNLTGKKLKKIVCGGKQNVIDVAEFINSKTEYKNINKLYFIDKDYSELNQYDKIYCLPSYSIENQYTETEVLRNILISEFGFDEDDDLEDFKIVISLFEKVRNDFHSETLKLNAWLACQAKYKEENDIKTFLKIDKTLKTYFKNPINSNFTISEKLKKLNNQEIIESLFDKSPKIATTKVERQVQNFDSSLYNLQFRGKFQLIFFISFLNRLQSEVGKKTPSLVSKKYKSTLRFEYTTALTNLSIYAITPDCLIDYVKNN